MISGKYIWPLFVFMVIAQLAVPIWNIKSSESVIQEGQVYKFEARPFDPFDPFRGKFVRLAFEVERPVYPIESPETIRKGQDLYASIVLNEEGFVQFDKIYTEVPEHLHAYVLVKCRFTNEDGVFINLPNNRFYMEETLAQPAEDLLRDRSILESEKVYAEVHILNGESRLTEVMVDATPIAQYVRQKLERKSVEE